MRKSKLQGFLTGLLAVSLLACPVFAAPFPDVDSNGSYATAIENISELGIMVGDTQGNFNPDKIVSRAEMATILCRVLGTEESLSKSDSFTDVPVAHWANAAVGKASELGIVNGYGNGKFGPSDPVTYEQAVTMLIRTLGEDNSANSNGGYPNGYLFVAREQNLLDGIQAVQGQGLTRGAVAMLLHNYYTWCPFKPGDGHTHHYEERTMPGSGTGGHYEQVQVQVGTKTVEEYATVTTYHCKACGLTTTNSSELMNHISTGPCVSSGWWYETKNGVVGTHEEPMYETRTKWVNDSTITIRVCALCGQMESPSHDHQYVERTVPGSDSGGHYEQVQVQVGTKTVNDYGQVTTYGCRACNYTTTDPTEIRKHGQTPGNGCYGGGWWSTTKNSVVGTHEEPVYETRTKWVDGSATTARVCSICGQQEP